MIRIAVNGDKAAAQEWFDRMSAIARGDDPDEQPSVVIASEEDAARFLRSLGR
jgi:hypothetical protein